MKKLIGTIILIIVLTGCSSVGKSVSDTSKQAANNTTAQNASSSSNQQSQSESKPQNIKDTNSDASAALIENMDTTKSQFKKGYYDYQGTINNNLSIQMSIYPLEKGMVGTYFYDKQRQEIKLQGKAGEKDIILYEYDETGKSTGMFQGTMKTVDRIDGTWTSADNKNRYPFVLSLKSIIPGAEYGKRYAVALNTKNDQDVEDFLSKVQSYALNGNKEQLAEEVVYPISAKINGEVTKIQSKDDFIKNYDLIFYPKYKQVISNAYTKYLFVNWQGIMFGDGLNNIWINEVIPDDSNSKLMITAINN